MLINSNNNNNNNQIGKIPIFGTKHKKWSGLVIDVRLLTQLIQKNVSCVSTQRDML